MGNRFNKNSIRFVGIAVMLMFAFAKCNHNASPSINAYMVEHTDEWQKIKLQNIDTTNSVKVKLQFLNNPYKFDSNNDLAIYVNQALVFKGSFESLLDLYLPVKFLGDRALPAITIYNGKKAYNFIHKKSMFLNADDKYLYVVFCPENELMESCYMFSQKEPIL
jgi:hypothetical protein